MKKPATLNDKQALFAQEYLIDLNATRAAQRAGYTFDTAYSTGCRLLKNPAILARVNELKAQRMQQLNIDADYVLLRLVDIDRMDVLDILDTNMNLKPVDDWPLVWRQSVSQIDVADMAEGKEVSGILKKIKWPDKVKNLELIGKHVSVAAFKDRLEHSGAIDTLTDEALEEKITQLLEVTAEPV